MRKIEKLFLIFVLTGLLLKTPVWGLFSGEIIDEVIFSVNGKIFTRKDFEENVRIFKEFYLDKKSLSEENIKEVVLKKTIDEILLEEQAEREGIKVLPEELERALKALRGKLTEEMFLNRLKEKGITYDGLKRKIEREILAEKMMKWKAERIKEEIEIKEDEIKDFFALLKQYIYGEKVENEEIINFYEIYSRQIDQEEKVWLLQIVVEGKERAEKVLQNIEEGKENFSEAAKRFSIGPAAEKGGDLGWLSLTQIQKPLRSIVGKMKEGEVTSPIKINEKYYRILQVKAHKSLSFEKWKDKIKIYLLNRKTIQELDRWLKKLEQESFIQIIEKDLKEKWKSL